MTFFSSFFAFDFALFVSAVLLMFSVLDAVGTAPIFVSLSEGYPEHRKRIVSQAVAIATAILVIFALFGWLIFSLFGITVDDFKIAGGIVLFIIAVDHLMGTANRSRGLEPSDIAVFPLATPLLAGPGAISTAVILSGPPYSPFIALLVIAINGVLAYLILSSADWVRKFLGANGSNALSRITALLIAALAISFVVGGITDIAKMVG